MPNPEDEVMASFYKEVDRIMDAKEEDARYRNSLAETQADTETWLVRGWAQDCEDIPVVAIGYSGGF